MNDVDAEYYLRRCGEDSLERRHSSDNLHQRARALAAIDVVSPAAAAKVVADYGQARNLRGLFDDGRHSEDAVADEWAPPTIRSCGQTVDIGWGAITLHFVTIGTDESSIAVTMKQNPPAPAKGRGQPRHRHLHEEAPELDIADDKGTTRSANFGGSGNGREWEGSYSIHPPLDPATEFITVMGHRVDLGPSPDDVAVRVEEVDPGRPAAERAARYVRRCLAAPANHHFEESTVPATIDTFLACGILTPDDDVIVRAREAQTVADQAVPGLSPGVVGSRSSSRATRRRSRPVDRTIGVAVSLPGGVHVAITDLRSRPEGVLIGFQAAVTSAQAMVRSLADCFAMTTTDDAGVEHLGWLEGWGSGGGGFHGQLRFPAPLSGSTFPLRILTDRADVTLDIPLRWEGGP